MKALPNLELLLAPLAMVVGAAVCLGTLYFWRQGRELRAQGVNVQAVVEKKFRKSGEWLENTYAVFSFVDAAGRRQQVEVKVASRSWHGLRVGGMETLTYIPGRPETAAYGALWVRELLAWMLLSFALTGGGMAVAGLCVLVRALLRTVLQRP